MITEIPFMILVVVVVAVIGLFVLVRSFTMPPNYFKNQKKREELQRKLKASEAFEEEMKAMENVEKK